MTITPRHTIRTFALVCVTFTTVFVIGMSIWLVRQIANTDWCGKVVGSSNYAGGRPDFAINGCVQVMLAQINALANNSLIFGGVIALCLAALMVIVVAGGKLSFKGPGGLAADVGRDGPADGAQAATDAAQDVADQLATGAPAVGNE